MRRLGGFHDTSGGLLGLQQFGAGSFPPYSPLAWYKPDVGAFQTDGGSAATADADPVGKLLDRSGNGHHATQVTAAARPRLDTYSLGAFQPTLYLDGVFGQLALPASLSVNAATMSVFMSVIAQGVNWTQVLASFPAASSNAFVYKVADDNSWNLAPVAPATQAEPSGFYTVGFLSRSGASQLRVNGAITSGAQFPSSVMTGGFLGNWQAGTCNAHFKVCEVLVYDRGLTNVEAAAVEAYLTAGKTLVGKYALNKPLLAFDGNSMIAGAGASNHNLSVVPKTISLLASPQAPYYSNGVGGGKTTELTSRFASIFGPLYSASRTKNILVIWEISNDIEVGLVTGAQAYTNIVAYCTAAKAAGWSVICLDCIKRSSFDATEETHRQTVNASLAADSPTVDATNIRHGAAYLDYLITVSADAIFANTGGAGYADGVHPSTAGHAVVAGYLDTTLGLLGVT